MITIELDYSGHYPSRLVEVTDEEYKLLKALNDRYGMLYDTLTRGNQQERKFVREIFQRPSVQNTVPKFVAYI